MNDLTLDTDIDLNDPDLIRNQIFLYNQVEQEKKDREIAQQLQNQENETCSRRHVNEPLNEDNDVEIIDDDVNIERANTAEQNLTRRRHIHYENSDEPPFRRARVATPELSDESDSFNESGTSINGESDFEESESDNSEVNPNDTTQLVSSDSESDDEIDYSQFESPTFRNTYRGELEIFSPLSENGSFHRAGLRSIENEVASPNTNVERTDQYGECTICFDKPAEPTGCNNCKQLLGCKRCVNRWHSSVVRAGTRPSCPLCRAHWRNRPNVKPMFQIVARQRLRSNQSKSL